MKVRSCSKRYLWLVLVLPFCCCWSVWSLAAVADFRDEMKQPQQLVSPPSITLEQAADKVRRETGGRVLSAAPSTKGGKRGYDVRVLLDGKRVKKVFVDARAKR